jgi:hypothetical protein
MSVSSVASSNAAVATLANKPVQAPAPVADAPHDGDGDDHAAPVGPGVGNVVDKKA